MEPMNTKRVSFSVGNRGTGESALERVLFKKLLNSDDSRSTQSKFLEKFRTTADNLKTTYPGKKPELLWDHVENIVASGSQRVARCDTIGNLVDDLFKPEGSSQLVPRLQLKLPRPTRVPLYRFVPTTPERNILGNFDLSKVNGVLCYPMTESRLCNRHSVPPSMTQVPTLTSLFGASPKAYQEEARNSSLETQCGSSTSYTCPSLTTSDPSVSSHNVNDVRMDAADRSTAPFPSLKSGTKRKSAVLDGGTLNRVPDFKKSRITSWSTGSQASVRSKSRIPIRKANPPRTKETYSKRFEDKGSQTSPECGRESGETGTEDSCTSRTPEPFDLDAKIAEVLARPTPPGLVRGDSWDSKDEFLAKLSPISIPSILDDISTDYSEDSELSQFSDWSTGSGSEPTSSFASPGESSPGPFTFCSPESYTAPSPGAFESQSLGNFGSQSSEIFESPEHSDSQERGSPEALRAGSPQSPTMWSPEAFEPQSPEKVEKYSPKASTARSRNEIARQPPVVRQRHTLTTYSEREPVGYPERASLAYSKRLSDSHSERAPVVYSRRSSVLEHPPGASAGRSPPDYVRRSSTGYAKGSSSDYRRRSPERSVRHPSGFYAGRSHEASKPRSAAPSAVSHPRDFCRPSVPASRRKQKPPPPMSARPQHEFRSGREQPPDRRAKSVSVRHAPTLNFRHIFNP